MATHDVRFVIEVDDMYGLDWMKPMVVDYLGEVNLVASKPGVAGRYTCELVVPEQYRKLPPAPPRQGTSTSSPALPRPPPTHPPSLPASMLQPAKSSAPKGQKKKGKGKELRFSEKPNMQFVPSCPNWEESPRIAGLRGQLPDSSPKDPRRAAQQPYNPSGQMTLKGLSVPILTAQFAKLKEVLVRRGKQRLGKVYFDQYGGMFRKFKDLLREVGVDTSKSLELQIYRDCFHGQHTPWTLEMLVAKALQLRLQGITSKQVTEGMKAYRNG